MIEIPCKQYDQEWWRVRRGIPTASEFSNLITAKKLDYAAAATEYANQLVADIFDLTYPPLDQAKSSAMRYGTIAEPETRRWVEMELGTNVREVGFIKSDCGRFGCSPDGIIDAEEAGLELKNPSAKVQVGRLRAGQVIPAEYMAQVHGSMLVSGLNKWYFVSRAIGLPPLIVKAEPNEFTEKLRGHMDRFYAEFQIALEMIKAL